MADEQTIKNVLLNTERLKILRDLALIDSPAETVYDRITQLASKAVGSPVSLVSMVGSDYQFFKSFVGLPEPWASDRSTPLSHSFCQHVVATNEPLIVSDARNVDFLKDNLAIPDLNVIGYLGIPLTLQSGQRLGSFCVIDGKPREWQPIEIEIVRELSELTTQEIELRAKANLSPELRPKLEEAHATIGKMIDELNASGDVSQEAFLQQLRTVRQKFVF
jgi:GAF domain-containing protein